MDNLLQDLKYALRSLARSPAFTTAAILTLALGIGANTAIFSIVDGVLLRPAPIEDADRVMMVWETDQKSGTKREPSSYPDFLDFQQRSKSFSSLAAFTPLTVNLTQPGSDPDRVNALGITVEYPTTVRLSTVAGRLLEKAETEPGGPRSALISESLADRVFGGKASAIGKPLRLNDLDWTVVGVLPSSADFGARQILGAAAYQRGFADRSERSHVDVWLGLRTNATSSPRTTHPIFVVGRLVRGATPEQAQKEFSAITTDLAREFHVDNFGRGAFIESLPAVVFGDVRPALLTLLAAVGLVLLVACANVANLLLVRSTARLREVTVRVALGAGLRRLAQQFAVEGIVLTAAGAALGVGLASLAIDVLKALAPASIPRAEIVGIDGRVLAVTLGVSALVALAFALLPTLQARNHQLQSTLRGSGGRAGSAAREHRRFRSALIVSELAMASMLMIGAGLLVKSLYKLQNVDTGFASQGVLKGEYQLPASRYPRNFANFPKWPEQERFNSDLLTRVRSLPGVEEATIASSHPLDAGFTSSIVVVGREAEASKWAEPSIRQVASGYFETMRIPLRSGRSFEASDNADGPPVMVINESAVAAYFGESVAIGQKINLWGAQRLVVGVVANERLHGLTKDAPPALYMPLAQAPANGGHSILLRVRGEPSAFAGALRSTMKDLDARLPVYGVEPLPETIAHSIGQQRFTMIVLGSFAAVALLLAAVGVHGVLSYSVSQRMPEIGIRMALGADGRSVRTLVLGEGAVLMVTGLSIGLIGAVAMTRVLTALLYNVSPYDPITFGGVALALGGVAMFATYLPARRASKVDPVEALRSE
jgi:putative ABC transport system permease protein